jgi:hypothetical protein
VSFILNEYEVDEAVRRHGLGGPEDERPNLRAAVITLDNLVDWTNQNSDGWPYWRKPAQASKQLQQLVHDATFGRARFEPEVADISTADLRRALRPIKAFRTRQSATFTIEEPK